jgi:hypothetical protein
MKNRAKNRSRGLSRLTLLLCAAALPVFAQPIAKAVNNNVSLTVYDEDCKLKSSVVNLPKRAVWEEGGKKIEGCWGAQPEAGVLIFYFADKTVAMAPIQMFEPVTGA